MKHHKIIPRLSAALALAVLIFSGCSRRLESPNLLLITLDTTRADHIGCYGYKQALTPVLDQLAESGTLFENTFTCVPLTLPSHASILTGLYPPEHGLRLNGESRLNPETETLATQLQKKGYRTGAFIAAFVLDSRFGLDNGFEVYDDHIGGQFSSESWLRRHRSGDRVVDSALAWLADHYTQPFFCWVHLFDPHNPYNPHIDLFGDRFKKTPYDGEIAFDDQQVGRLIDFLDHTGIRKNTLVIIVGDHGESLGEHGERQHGILLYDGALKVPLIISQPGVVQASHREETYVSTTDIAPTVLDMMGYKPIPQSANTLRPALTGGLLDPTSLYAETDLPFVQYGWAPLRAIILEPRKYIETPKPELYNMEKDPEEKDNLIESDQKLSEQMRQQLAEMESRFVQHEAQSATLSDDDRRVLESLGYVSRFDNRKKSISTSSLPDIKDRIHLLETGNKIRDMIQRGQAESALKHVEEALREDPENTDLLLSKASALAANNRHPEAEIILRKLLSNPNTTPFEISLPASLLLSKCRYQQGDQKEALAILRETHRIDPDNVLVMNGLAWLLATKQDADRKDGEEAVAIALQVINLVGINASSKYLDTLAAAYAAAGNFDQAVYTQKQALQLARKKGNRMTREYTHRLKRYQSGQRYKE